MVSVFNGAVISTSVFRTVLPGADGVGTHGSHFLHYLTVKAGTPRYHRPKFHAQFQVGEEEAHRPGEGLTKGLDKLTPTVTSPPGGFPIRGLSNKKPTPTS